MAVVVCVCVCGVVWCGTLKTPCVDSKRPRVYRHHTHMLKHMCAWCRYTRGRFESRHGGVLNVHTVPCPPLPTHTDTTSHGDRQGERARKKTEKERGKKTKEEREETTRGGAEEEERRDDERWRGRKKRENKEKKTAT